MPRRRKPVVDYSEFMRSSWELTGLSTVDLGHLALFGAGLRPDTRPDLVPLEALDLMGWDPVIYAGERALTASSRDPELYYLRGDDPALVAEVEAWLRPLLPGLLGAAARSYAYGVVPVVLDWEMSDLVVRREDRERTRTLPAHVHYADVHELWPGECTITPKGDRLLELRYRGQTFGGPGADNPGDTRAFCAIWDGEFGRWQGKGSRRRAYHAWFDGALAAKWRNRYLERAVDLPRVGYAPEGNLEVGEETISAVKLLRSAIMSLRNGSTIVLPSTRDEQGNEQWQVKVLESPDRSEVFHQAIDRFDKLKLWACLSPGGAPPDKATEEAFMDSVQSVCDHAAQFISQIVRAAVRLRDPDAVAPVVLANDVPKRKLRIAKEVFSAVAAVTHHLEDGRVYTLGELVHPEILDQLGIRTRSVEEAAHEPGLPEATAESVKTESEVEQPGQGGGPDVDLASDREERRDGAETIEREDDTGGDDQERDERD